MVERRIIDIPREQIDARLAMGDAIRIWFRINRWSQDVPNSYAKQRGLNGPWNSQMSLWMSGKLDPKAQFWLSVEHFNLCVAEQSFDGLEPELIRRLEHGCPFETYRGEPARAEDLYAMFIGRLAWHDRFTREPLITKQEAEKLGKNYEKAVETVMLDSMMTRAELWQKIVGSLDPNTDLDAIILKRWLVGIDPYTPEIHRDFGRLLSDVLSQRKD